MFKTVYDLTKPLNFDDFPYRCYVFDDEPKKKPYYFEDEIEDDEEAFEMAQGGGYYFEDEIDEDYEPPFRFDEEEDEEEWGGDAHEDAYEDTIDVFCEMDPSQVDWSSYDINNLIF